MPEIFRFFGFSFFFYSREHDPLHVHVEGNGGMAKFEWNGTEFVLVERIGIKAVTSRRSRPSSMRMRTSLSPSGTNISTSKRGTGYDQNQGNMVQ